MNTNTDIEKESNILLQIQQNLNALQKQIDNMKTPENSIEIPDTQSIDLRYKLKEKAEELIQIMREILNSEANEPGICMSALLSVSADETERAVFYSVENLSALEKIDEKRLANAIEAFSSPKRITILKTLMSKKFMSSNELTMKTGCIGGQLYHHLSILESAKIICKSSELYTLTDYGRNMISQIFGIVLGESL